MFESVVGLSPRRAELESALAAHESDVHVYIACARII